MSRVRVPSLTLKSPRTYRSSGFFIGPVAVSDFGFARIDHGRNLIPGTLIQSERRVLVA